MPRTPPAAGYVRPMKFGSWPASSIPLPNRHRMTRAQCDRFFNSLQNLIARHMFDTEGVYLYEIGLFWVGANRPSTFTGEVDQVAGTYRDLYHEIEVPQRRAFVMHYTMASELRRPYLV